MKKTIKDLYLFTFMSLTIILIFSIMGNIIFITNHYECLKVFGNRVGIVLLTSAICVFTITGFYSIKLIIVMLKDISSLKNKQYVFIVAKVLRFKKNREPESGIQINDRPIILIIDTNEEIELIINDNITVSEIYKFNYLNHCKIAEVVEKI